MYLRVALRLGMIVFKKVFLFGFDERDLTSIVSHPDHEHSLFREFQRVAMFEDIQKIAVLDQLYGQCQGTINRSETRGKLRIEWKSHGATRLRGKNWPPISKDAYPFASLA